MQASVGSIFSPGIKSAVVALLAQKAEVNYDKTVTNVVEVVKHISDLGYQTSVLEDNAKGHSTIELAVSTNLFCSILNEKIYLVCCLQGNEFFVCHHKLVLFICRVLK